MQDNETRLNEIRPSVQDQEKLHQEITQMMNQRFLLTTSAVFLFTGMLVWGIPKSTGENDLVFIQNITQTVCLSLLLILLALLIAHTALSLYSRVLTTYLKVSGASRWEDHWHAFRLSESRFWYKKLHMGYTLPQMLVFGLLGGLTAVCPYFLALQKGISWKCVLTEVGPTMLICGSIYIFLIFVLGQINKSKKYETYMIERWQKVLVGRLLISNNETSRPNV